MSQMELPQFIELLKMKADDDVKLNLLKSRYNRYATRYNQAFGLGESLRIFLYAQLELLKEQIEQIKTRGE